MPPAPQGLPREGALGGTEMQDRLHILEDLNMLYIRQMALSLEVKPPPLGYELLPLAPQPIAAFLVPAGAGGRVGLLKVGRGTGDSLWPVLGAVYGPRPVLLIRTLC